MATRRDLLTSIPATGAAFAVAGSALFDESPARAADTQPPLADHFHPRGKAPSAFTLDAIRKSSANLPFADQRDFEELNKGLIAPMPETRSVTPPCTPRWPQAKARFRTS